MTDTRQTVDESMKLYLVTFHLLYHENKSQAFIVRPQLSAAAVTDQMTAVGLPAANSTL